VIEDAAQAHGAIYRGRRVGGWGTAACFSFYPGKNLGCYGDGGALVTDDDQLAARVRRLRDHGRRDKYEHIEVGYGERLDALQAAVLAVKLPYLDEWNHRRRRAADRYRSLLDGAPVGLPGTTPEAEPVHHLFVLRVAGRDRVLERLRAAGVGAGIHYPIPLHRQPAYAHLGHSAGAFPEAERAAEEVLSLPLYPEITDAQIAAVAAALRASLD
jgi:dTDP-4-amino-4,6-dideoxygalactose transaminase